MNKSADSLTQRGLALGQAGCFLPSEIGQGIYRYIKLAGNCYSVYRETTKKYIGLALYDGKEFTPCTPWDLVEALENESKNRK